MMRAWWILPVPKSNGIDEELDQCREMKWLMFNDFPISFGTDHEVLSQILL
jgi:hypothetical protein